jgi:transcriptional regulator with PAS, ATPase and Fis domain
MLTEEGSKGVDAASSLVVNISEALEKITGAVLETTSAASEIKLMTQQQTTASEQMTETIVEVRDVAVQVATSSQETTQSIAELTALAERLQDLVDENLQSKGEAAAIAGSKEMERVLTEAVERGRFTIEEFFDENYQLISDTDPKKYHTCYDSYMDETIKTYQDQFLNNEMVAFAVLVDRNGYLPTHNSKYTQPLTGDYKTDLVGNRTKRIFDHDVGIKAARNQKGLLTQPYERDTGEKMLDISAPVYVKGKHWGAFRIGYQMD